MKFKKILIPSLLLSLAVTGCNPATTTTQPPTSALPSSIVSSVDDATALSIINNLVIADVSEAEEGEFDLVGHLPTISVTVTTSFSVTNANEDVINVNNNKFFVLAGITYTVKVTYTYKTTPIVKTFTVIGAGESEEVEDLDDAIIISSNLITLAQTTTFGYGLYEITGINQTGSIPEAQYDRYGTKLITPVSNVASPLVVDYSVSSINNPEISQEVIYTFNGHELGTSEGDALASVTNKAITFKQPGLVEVGIASITNPSLVKQFSVHVNNGFNVSTVEQMHLALTQNEIIDYAHIEQSHPINLFADLTLTGNPFENVFYTYKPELIYGNNHKIDGSGLDKAVYVQNTDDANRNLAVINFISSIHNYFPKIEIHDLDIKGNGVYNAPYTSSNPASPDHPKSVVGGITFAPTIFLESDKSPRPDRDYATRSTDGLKIEVSSKHTVYRHAIEAVSLNNVHVTKTLIGIRLHNVNNADFKDVSSTESFLHNIEITDTASVSLENTHVGLAGGSAIEVKEDYSKIYRFEGVNTLDTAQFEDSAPWFVPADTYNPENIYADNGYLLYSPLILAADGGPGLTYAEAQSAYQAYYINNDTSVRVPLLVGRIYESSYIATQTITIKGVFACDNWTVGDETYYMTPSSTPDSSNYLIMKLKETYKTRVKTDTDGKEKINYAIGILSWGKKNESKVVISSSSFGFSAANVLIKDVVPGAGGWAAPVSSVFYLNLPLNS
jgi:hypothetical protein